MSFLFDEKHVKVTQTFSCEQGCRKYCSFAARLQFDVYSSILLVCSSTKNAFRRNARWCFLFRWLITSHGFLNQDASADNFYRHSITPTWFIKHQ